MLVILLTVTTACSIQLVCIKKKKNNKKMDKQMRCNIVWALNKTNLFHGHAAEGLYARWVNTPLSLRFVYSPAHVCLGWCLCYTKNGNMWGQMVSSPYNVRSVCLCCSWDLGTLPCWRPRAHVRLKGSVWGRGITWTTLQGNGWGGDVYWEGIVWRADMLPYKEMKKSVRGGATGSADMLLLWSKWI